MNYRKFYCLVTPTSSSLCTFYTVLQMKKKKKSCLIANRITIIQINDEIDTEGYEMSVKSSFKSLGTG